MIHADDRMANFGHACMVTRMESSDKPDDALAAAAADLERVLATTLRDSTETPALASNVKIRHIGQVINGPVTIGTLVQNFQRIP